MLIYGPSQGAPLQDAITAFDFLNVQFYNNYCKYHTRQHLRIYQIMEAVVIIADQ